MRLAAAPALALLAAIAALAAGCGGSEPAALPHHRAIVATASLDPPTHLFAEPVQARVDVLVDGAKLDPARIRVKTAFAPYEVLSATREREDLGGLTRFRYRFTIRCLLIECVPKIIPSAAGEAESGRGDRMTFDFGRVRVLYRDPKGEPRPVASAAWPTLESVSRINAPSVPDIGFVFKTSVTPLPSATYRIAPALLAVLLLAVAALLFVLPAVLVSRWWRSRQPAAPAPEPELPPLERALRLVERSLRREDGPERREALEVLAHELDVADGSPLALDARGLAWSAPSPSRRSAEELVETVRRSNGASA